MAISVKILFEVGRSFEEGWKKLNLNEENWADFKIRSLGDALIAAMQTINGAANTTSGKATMLLPREREISGGPPSVCPVKLPTNLEDKNSCEYFGYYHTDFTLPSEYFLKDVHRPATITGYNLDFTYLFSDKLDNPAHSEMGKGIWVRLRARRKARKTPKQKIKRAIGDQA